MRDDILYHPFFHPSFHFIVYHLTSLDACENNLIENAGSRTFWFTNSSNLVNLLLLAYATSFEVWDNMESLQWLFSSNLIDQTFLNVWHVGTMIRIVIAHLNLLYPSDTNCMTHADQPPEITTYAYSTQLFLHCILVTIPPIPNWYLLCWKFGMNFWYSIFSNKIK